MHFVRVSNIVGCSLCMLSCFVVNVVTAASTTVAPLRSLQLQGKDLIPLGIMPGSSFLGGSPWKISLRLTNIWWNIETLSLVYRKSHLSPPSPRFVLFLDAFFPVTLHLIVVCCCHCKTVSLVALSHNSSFFQSQSQVIFFHFATKELRPCKIYARRCMSR